MNITKTDTSLARIIPPELAKAYQVFPIELSADTLKIGLVNGTNLDVINELRVLIGYELKPVFFSESEIGSYLSKYYKGAEGESRVNQESAFTNQEDLIWDLIQEAKSLGSSDIHLEPYEEYARFRFRLDGKLYERYRVPIEEFPAYVNQIKIQCSLDISEKRLPQDGRMHFSLSESNKLDLRVSVLPSMYGEKIVMRILHKTVESLSIKSLGMNKNDLGRYLSGVERPHGIVLISGPTGSGKSTTLYATLKHLNSGDRNILTVEDPIEYTLEGITQVQVRENIGLDFAKAMRTFLRQDPDIIMVGEIRDVETAQMAIRAALTGHLVLSTIHTNSAWGILTRLLDMQIAGYLLAETVNMVVAQRLVRLLCPVCKKPTETSHAELVHQRLSPFITGSHHFEPLGCANCHFSGYSGRRAIYEVLPIDDFLKQAIRANTVDVSSHIQETGASTLLKGGIDLYNEGLTSLNEISFLLNE